jgi:hypothetical protein
MPFAMLVKRNLSVALPNAVDNEVIPVEDDADSDVN